MKTQIIVDSSADLLPQTKEMVTVVPLTVRFGTEEFLDGVTIDHQTFYEKLVESDTLPTTSQAVPQDFMDVFDKTRAAQTGAVVITLSSHLSGTYQSARIAAAEYENIFVVDSGTVTIGGGILVELALELAEEGLDAGEIARRLEEAKGRIVLVALLDTLEYLKKGGRISKTVAFAGNLLNIKPVISVVDGEIHLIGKARGSKTGNNLLVQEMEKAGGIDFTMPVLLGYTGLSDTLLQKYIGDSQYIWSPHMQQVPCTVVGSVVGTHAGPGAIAVAFFKKAGSSD